MLPGSRTLAPDGSGGNGRVKLRLWEGQGSEMGEGERARRVSTTRSDTDDTHCSNSQTTNDLVSIDEHGGGTVGEDVKQVSVLSLGDDVGTRSDGRTLHDVHHVGDGLLVQVVEHVVVLKIKGERRRRRMNEG